MAFVIFYEKPGCINNTKQKALLKSAGHSVDARNFLTASWTAERLRGFFGDRPISEWFNKTAPAIKSGAIDPENVDVDTALALMLADPLLIRRPLIQVDDRVTVGFDPELIDTWIGLDAANPEDRKIRDRLLAQDLQTCSQPAVPCASVSRSQP